MSTVTPVRINEERYADAVEFLYREADLLDNYRFEEWLGLLHEDLAYRMPVRLSVMPKDGTGLVDGMDFLVESRGSMVTRVKRLQTEQAWAEQPGSRTRHVVANVVVAADGDEELHVRSGFIVTRTRADDPYDIFTGERHDVLASGEDGLLLKRRDIVFDQTVMHSYNLSIFL
jgi:3-phenylpropionate/cinnamic acid dioxygenase small subunit